MAAIDEEPHHIDPETAQPSLDVIQPDMSKPITARQAAARRSNGAKSRGPKTPKGKARSRANATRHGAYAIQVPWIQQGVLGENPTEVVEFTRMMVQSLDPGDDRLLIRLAHDVARAMWRLSRLDHWEAHGLSWIQAEEGVDQASFLDYLAGCDEAAAAQMGHLGDGTLSRDELWNLLGRLGMHPNNKVDTELPDDTAEDEIALVHRRPPGPLLHRTCPSNKVPVR